MAITISIDITVQLLSALAAARDQETGAKYCL